jgi:hypothetical protein
MNEPKPEWYTHLKEESFQGKPFNMEKIRKAEQRVAKWTVDLNNRQRKNKWGIAVFSMAICLSVLLFAVLFNGEGVDWLKAKVQTTVEINQPAEQKTELVILTESKDKRIAILGDINSADNGMLEGITVRIDNSTRKFDWTNTINPSFYPEVWLANVAGDDKPEVIIGLTHGTGTGVHESEVHVLNLDFSEIKVNDPKKEVEQFIHVNASKKAEKQIYSITVSGKVHLFEYNETDAGIWFDQVAFGNVINFSVQDHTLIAEVSAQVSPGTFTGTVKMIYALKEGVLQVTQVEWIDDLVSTVLPKVKTYDEINEALTQGTLGNYIHNIAWSPDHKIAVYHKDNLSIGKVYLWRVGEEEAIPVVINKSSDIIVSAFIWTPDSEHFLVDDGTAVDRGGYLISVKNLQSKEVHYHSNVYFSPDSKRMLFSEWVNILSSYKKDIEAGYSYDLSVLNLDTYEVTALMKPTDTTDFIAQGWSDNSTVKYTKKDYSKQTEENLELALDKKIPVKIRAAGKTKFGDMQIVSKSEETIETLGAPGCVGLAEDYLIKGDYQVLFKNGQGKENVVSENELKSMISPTKETISMNKLTFKEFDSLSFTPAYTDCHGIQFYMYGVTAKDAFPFKFQTDQGTTDSYYMGPTTKLKVIEDQLIVEGGRAAGDVGYAIRYIFKPDIATKTMILVKTEQVE